MKEKEWYKNMVKRWEELLSSLTKNMLMILLIYLRNIKFNTNSLKSGFKCIII